MRCFITGASGHLGSHLVRSLLHQGADIYALVRPSSNLWRLEDILGQITLVQGDMADVSGFSAKLRHSRIDTFFHLAWHGITAELRDSNQQITENVFGSLKLVELARDLRCKAWIGIGSQAEYGKYSGSLAETDLTCPTSIYGTAKLCVGMLSKKMCELAGIRHLWFRLFATYGPFDDERHLIPSLINDLLQGKRTPLTPSQQKWDYLFVEDAVEAICKSAQSEISGVYNLGSGVTNSIESVALHIRALIDSTAPLGLGDLQYGPNQIMHLQADITKLRDVLEWYPRTNIADGLRTTVEWHRRRQGRMSVGQ